MMDDHVSESTHRWVFLCERTCQQEPSAKSAAFHWIHLLTNQKSRHKKYSDKKYKTIGIQKSLIRGTIWWPQRFLSEISSQTPDIK